MRPVRQFVQVGSCSKGAPACPANRWSFRTGYRRAKPCADAASRRPPGRQHPCRDPARQSEHQAWFTAAPRRRRPDRHIRRGTHRANRDPAPPAPALVGNPCRARSRAVRATSEIHCCRDHTPRGRRNRGPGRRDRIGAIRDWACLDRHHRQKVRAARHRTRRARVRPDRRGVRRQIQIDRVRGGRRLGDRPAAFHLNRAEGRAVEPAPRIGAFGPRRSCAIAAPMLRPSV